MHAKRNCLRILIISDIHANLEALEACLKAAPEHDRVFNLGDLVGYGANPNEVTERARALGEVFVRGNHDKACTGLMSLDDFNPVAARAALWTRERLSEDNMNFLRGLPQGPVAPLKDLQCVHGSPRDEDEYVLTGREAYSILERTAPQLTFFGHTHVQGGFIWNQSRVETILRPSSGSDYEFLDIDPECAYLINPGSVGQPRDGDPRAGYVIYDSEDRRVKYCRVVYDVAGAQKKIHDVGLPQILADRLSVGR